LFPTLPPGIYNLKAEKSGFKTLVQNKVEIQVQQNARIDFRLEVGQVTELIEVAAGTETIVTENATVGTVIENKRIVDLPLNGRNYTQLVSLAPNVSADFSVQGQAAARQGDIRAAQAISVAGQRTNFNQYTLHGVENTDPNFNTFVVLPSIDALQEFKVQTGVYPAEFGRQTTQINVLSKSGTNQYHGTAFEFLRNDKLDATQYAFTSLRPTKDPFKWNQYGFTLAGPVRIPKVFNGKDKLFFMGNYESYRKRGSATGLFSLAPTAFQTGDFSSSSKLIFDPRSRRTAADGTLAGDPFPGNIIPTSKIHPTSLKLPGRSPVALPIRILACWYWWMTAGAPTTTPWAPSLQNVTPTASRHWSPTRGPSRSIPSVESARPIAIHCFRRMEGACFATADCRRSTTVTGWWFLVFTICLSGSRENLGSRIAP
jgi:hypothetical protein